MKFRPRNTGPVRGFLALSVSVAVLASNCLFAFASSSKSTNLSQPAQVHITGGLLSADAVVTETGVRVEWRSDFDINNLGFNVYRLRAGKRVRLNREIIPGSIFVAGPNGAQNSPRGVSRNLSSPGSYAWFDRAGTPDSIYHIESVSQWRVATLHEALVPVAEAGGDANKKSRVLNEEASAPDPSGWQSDDQNYASFETSYPAVTRAPIRSNMMASTIEDQWSIAGRVGLKIGIKKDGWYRVTQPQMAAAGFNPVVDIRNLQLFVGGQEVAISTSQSGGTFGTSDYIEFFGRGVDVPTTDIRTYYLVASSAPGKRVGGELQIESPPSSPQPTPLPSPVTPGPGSKWSDWIVRKLTIAAGFPIGAPVIPMIIWGPSLADASPARGKNESAGEKPAATTVITAAEKKTLRRKSRKQRRPGRSRLGLERREYSHAVAALAAAPPSFDYTVQRKDRAVYFSSLLNGDEENWFGQVVANNPASQTINSPHPDTSAAGPARLEVRLQGVNFVMHQVDVSLNDQLLGRLSFFGHAGPAQVLNVPMGLLANGSNTVKFTPVTAPDTTLVNYTRLTYPRLFRADSDTLKFNLLGTQSLSVGGFTNQNVRLIDYTDPLNVRVLKPVVAPSGGGYAASVPTSSPMSKAQRLFYATALGPETPATLTLNQPSTLNAATNSANFLIIAHASLVPSFSTNVTPINKSFIQQRMEQGLSVSVVDVEDVFDEFGYGEHGPQAIKDFLARVNGFWAVKPTYVLFAGDASLDPRNYSGSPSGGFDFVPTRLVDATYNETASDEWMSDFDNNGIGEFAIGRLPVRTAADANLIISKIVNYAPSNVPQSALLVADDPGTPPVWDFESGNSDVAALLPPSITVQRIDIRTQPSNAQATANIIAALNEGKAIVNYSGHGNVDVWTGNQIFKAAHATALTNDNRLSFVIVMDCLNGYFHDPNLLSLSEAFMKAPGGGSVATFASSGLTTTFGQRQMELELYRQLYGPQVMGLGDAVKIAKAASSDIDVRRTWIFFGDPSMKIR